MNKQTMLIIFAIILIANLNFALAEIEFFQFKIDMGNGTIKNHLVGFYDKEGGVSENYVSGNNPYEVYLLYNFYVNKWNADNPNFKINKCDWLVYFWGHLQNSTTLVFNQSYTGTDEDLFNAKYFMKLNDGDGIVADQICYFQNRSTNNLDVPAEMQLITPSWECKSCQYFEWSVQERSIIKAKSIGDNVVSVSDYIKKLFMLNFEIWLAIFWFFLIIMIFISIGLVFIMAYWFYIYLRRIMK